MILLQIAAPHMAAAVVLDGEPPVVVRFAPILKYMRGWDEAKVGEYCKAKHWQVEHVPTGGGSCAIDAPDRTVVELKAVNVLQTAVQDLATRDARNDEREQWKARRHDRTVPEPYPVVAPPYGFVAAHVRQATSPANLIMLALAHREEGMGSGRRATRLIYSDADRLQAALALAIERE